MTLKFIPSTLKRLMNPTKINENDFISFTAHLKNSHYSEHTKKAYLRDTYKLIELIKTLHNEKKLSTITARSLTSSHLKSIMANLHRSGYSTRSTLRFLAAIKSFYRHLIKCGIIEKDPTKSIHSIKKQPPPLPHLPDVDQIQRLFTFEVHDFLTARDMAILELFYSSGLRLSELTYANTDHINIHDKTMDVFGKNRMHRVVPVGQKAFDALKQWFSYRTKQLRNQQEKALFITQSGKRLTNRAVQYRIKHYAQKQLGTDTLHPHMLRHAFASHILESSKDLRAVQSMLGHKNINSTQVYTHLDHQYLAEVYDQCHPRD